MSQKRYPDGKTGRDDEGNCSDDKRRRVPGLKHVVLEMMRLDSVQHLVEPMIRKVVREEVELAITRHLTRMKQNNGNDGKKLYSSALRSLHLKFINNLSLPVFTGARIEGQDSSNLKVALIDSLTNKYVDSGPESSAKVEIVVLEGDFDDENWTIEDFKNNIVREREGKKPLLSGDAVLNLKDGIGLITENSFTDNSSWTRSRRFRLGARVVDTINGISIREAKTESFIVRDHRGELYKKHHPPSLFDEVWRLEKIGKDGAFHRRLSQENINTVKDFLTLLSIDPPRLRNILGTGMSAKMWEVTVEHARTCVLDRRMYLYTPHASQQKTGVVFNVVGHFMGLLSDCQYVPVDKLSEVEKADAQNMVISAFEHWDEVLCFDDETSLVDGSSHLSPMEGSFGSKCLASENLLGVDYTQPSAFSPDIISTICSVGISRALDDYHLPSIDNIGLRFDQSSSFSNQANSLICDTESLNHQVFYDEDRLQFFGSDINCNFNFESGAHSSAETYPWQRAQSRWTKLFSVLKWFSVRKTVARRRITRFSEIQRYSTGL